MVLYTVRLTGPEAAGRRVTLLFSTEEGQEQSTTDAEQGDEKKERGKTDHTGVITIWGPWASRVGVIVDGEQVAEVNNWVERPADRYTEIEAPPNRVSE